MFGIKKLFNWISNPITAVVDILTDPPEVKAAKISAKVAKVEAQQSLELAKINAQTEIAKQALSLDQQILQMRRNSYLDELVILLILAPAIIVFYPPAQTYVEKGFKILSALPDFYQALLVLVVVMVVGGVGLIRDLLNRFSLRSPK